MSLIENYLRLVRKDEYDEAEQQELINEAAQAQRFIDSQNDFKRRALPGKRARAKLNIAKKVICECVGDLYISSLIIDEPEKYESVLREAMDAQLDSEFDGINTFNELKNKFSNASPYVQSAILLSEAIANNKTDEQIDEMDKDEVKLDKDDIALIKDFEKIEGKDTYADEIQNRVVDVYKAEQELGEARQDKVQKIVEELSKIENKDGSITESALGKGLNYFSNVPKTLFNSIFINKSKAVLNECATGEDIAAHTEKIISDTVCTYTLLECIHALGIHTFTDAEKTRMRYEFFTAEV